MDDKKEPSSQLLKWRRYARWGRQLRDTIREIRRRGPDEGLDIRFQTLVRLVARACVYDLPPEGSYLWDPDRRLTWADHLAETAVGVYGDARPQGFSVVLRRGQSAFLQLG